MRPRNLVIVLAGVAFVLVSLFTASTGQTSGDHALPHADKVLVFGIPSLGLEDVTPARMPNLSRLRAVGRPARSG